MRIVEASLGDVYWVHKLYSEYIVDTKQEDQSHSINAWLSKFSKPGFFCFMGAHGKKYTGMVWGELREGRAEVEGVLVRRVYRGELRFVLPLVRTLKKYLIDSQIVDISILLPETYTKALARKGLMPKRLEFVRGVK